MEADDGGVRKHTRERAEPRERAHRPVFREGADRGGGLRRRVVRRERCRRGELALGGDGAAEIPERDPVDELCVRIRARSVARESTQFLRCLNGSPGGVELWSTSAAATAAGESGSTFSACCQEAAASALRPDQ